MIVDEQPQARTLHELLLEVRAGYVLHRPILVELSAREDAGAEATVERTLSMPTAGESSLAAELAGCGYLVLGPNKLAGPGAPLTVGRSRRCDVRIDNDSVSKVHGRVTFDEARGCLIVDEHSRNGTRVNGAVLTPGEPAPVFAGAQVSFGDATFVFLDPPTLRKLARLAT